MTRSIYALILVVVGCGGGGEELPAPGRPAPVEPFDPARDNEVSQPAGPTPAPAPASTGDGPHISRSTGEKGGIVVFWPRVIPKTDDPAVHEHAAMLQKQLAAIAEKKYPGKVDVRPEPERVCPRSGCSAATLGVLLAHGGGGCTAVALVADPGTSPTRLVPWAGKVRLKAQEVPFREYPESAVTISDAVPCDQLAAAAEKAAKDIESAL